MPAALPTADPLLVLAEALGTAEAPCDPKAALPDGSKDDRRAILALGRQRQKKA